MHDLKNTPRYKRQQHAPKPDSLMRGFIIACAVSAFYGVLIGMSLTLLRG